MRTSCDESATVLWSVKIWSPTADSTLRNSKTSTTPLSVRAARSCVHVRVHVCPAELGILGSRMGRVAKEIHLDHIWTSTHLKTAKVAPFDRA